MPALVPALLELEQARSLPAVGGVLRAAASPLGYDRLLVFATGTGLERDAQRVYWIEGDWFGDGSDTGLARYLHACPVNRMYWTAMHRSSGASARACAANAIRW